MVERKTKRLSPLATCPCKSGKKYGRCCYSKGFLWMRDEKGRIFKKVPEHPVLNAALAAMRQDFVRQFGREPTDKDSMWFGKLSAKWMKDKVTEAMVDTGFDPAFIYAYRKTGLLVFKENLHLIPDNDLREWNAAVRQFKRKKRRPLTRKERSNQKFLSQMVLVGDTSDRAIVFLRNIVRDHGIARNIGAKKKVHVFHDYMFFCATKALKSLGAIQLLVPEGFGEDALTLVRSVYESYLNMTFLLANPAKINDLVVAKVRLSAGLCKVTKTPTGKKIIQEKRSDKQFERLGPIHLARGSHYREDIHIHGVLYDFLCEHAHPNIMSMEAFLNKNLFEEGNTQMINQASMYSALYALLILDLLLRFRFLNDQFRKDLFCFLQESKPCMIKIFQLIEAKWKWIEGREQIISRIGHIGSSNEPLSQN